MPNKTMEEIQESAPDQVGALVLDGEEEREKSEFGLQVDGTEILPMVSLRDLVIFPGDPARFDVGRPQSRAAVEKAFAEKLPIMLVAQRDENVDEPVMKDMYMVGTIANVISVVNMPTQILSVTVGGFARAMLLDIMRFRPFEIARVQEISERVTDDDISIEACMTIARRFVQMIAQKADNIPAQFMHRLNAEQNPSRFADMIGMHMVPKLSDRIKVLETADVGKRLELLCRLLSRTQQLIDVEARIQKRVSEQIDKSQKEYYLREQIRAIQKELGDREAGDIEEYRRKAKTLPLNDEARDKVQREIDRLEAMAPGTPEMGVSSAYIEWILALPWGKRQTAAIDPLRARKALDKDHFGLDKVKERLVEYLAVRALKNDMKGPCLCLVGPPGVGKTSIAQSIARALKRPLAHVSLGGVRDEAEIRGHRRT